MALKIEPESFKIETSGFFFLFFFFYTEFVTDVECGVKAGENVGGMFELSSLPIWLPQSHLPR